MSFDRSIDTFLNEAQVAIDNALNNPEILGYLSDFGYTTARMQQGKKLYTLAAAAQLAQTAEAGEQVSATAAVNDAWTMAKKSYIRWVKVSRVALKGDSGAATQLDLSGKRKESLSGWLAQAKQFYNNALNDKTILKRLQDFGITEQKLKNGLKEIEAIEAANLVQEKEKGQAQAATQKRDTALDELQDWLSDYLAIAKVALEDNPQLLEGLGVLQRA
ncbi:MAG: hypothetical protein AAFU53_07535 [Cyanobacteria bacterium J06632_3]